MRLKIVHTYFFILLSFILFSCGASDEDYNEMAKDICDCMKENDGRQAAPCVRNLEEKYDDLLLYDSDEEFQQRLIKSMKNTEGCEEYAKIYEASRK